SQASITSNTTAGDGGAIATTSSLANVTIADCIISHNQATAPDSVGGAIAMSAGGILPVLRTSISTNSAGENGGGIHFLSGGSLTMTDSTLSYNTANSGMAGTGGGGIFFFGTVGAGGFTFTNSTISGNKTNAGSGGGIVLSAFTGTALIQNSTVTLNSATTNGGGIARTGGTGSVTLSSTIVAQNIN